MSIQLAAVCSEWNLVSYQSTTVNQQQSHNHYLDALVYKLKRKMLIYFCGENIGQGSTTDY